MKFFSLLFPLTLLTLCSCQLHNKKKSVSIIEEKKSIIQQWYGSDHFSNSNESKSETSSCEEESNTIENTTPAGNIFSKEFIEDHSFSQLPEQEFLFSEYLFQEASSDLDTLAPNLANPSHDE